MFHLVRGILVVLSALVFILSGSSVFLEISSLMVPLRHSLVIFVESISRSSQLLLSSVMRVLTVMLVVLQMRARLLEHVGNKRVCRQ